MVDLAALLSEEDLRRRFGSATLDRAWDYVRRGKVTGWTEWLGRQPVVVRLGVAVLTAAFVYAVVLVTLHVTGVPHWVPGWVPLWH